MTLFVDFVFLKCSWHSDLTTVPLTDNQLAHLVPFGGFLCFVSLPSSLPSTSTSSPSTSIASRITPPRRSATPTPAIGTAYRHSRNAREGVSDLKGMSVLALEGPRTRRELTLASPSFYLILDHKPKDLTSWTSAPCAWPPNIHLYVGTYVQTYILTYNTGIPTRSSIISPSNSGLFTDRRYTHHHQHHPRSIVSSLHLRIYHLDLGHGDLTFHWQRR